MTIKAIHHETPNSTSTAALSANPGYWRPIQGTERALFACPVRLRLAAGSRCGELQKRRHLRRNGIETGRRVATSGMQVSILVLVGVTVFRDRYVMNH